MVLKEILINLGLNKYEIEAYIYILQHGIVEASEISREANIPYGKIYETLNKLETYGFLEVQQTRPKKYRTREVNLSIEDFLTKKRSILEDEYASYKQLGNKFLDEVKNLNQVRKRETVFWRTAIGEDMHELYQASLKEAKFEIFFFSPHTIHDLHLIKNEDPIHNHDPTINLNQDKELIGNIKKNIQREIEIKILYAGIDECPHFRQIFSPFFEENSSVEIKTLPYEIVTTPLLVIDKAITLFDIVDPLDSHTTLGITKIYDHELAEKIYERLNILWERAQNYSEKYPIIVENK